MSFKTDQLQTIRFLSYETREVEFREKIIRMLRFEVYVDNRKVGEPGLVQLTEIINRSGAAERHGTEIVLAEGDTLRFRGNYDVTVSRILVENSKALPLADVSASALLKLTALPPT